MPATSPGSRLGAFVSRLSVLVVLASVGLVSASAPAQAQACIAGTDSDFDGDGVADLTIGDPDATVNGKVRAGRIHIAYGDGASVTIDADGLPDNDNGAGERFGFTMDSTDWNGDGCSDLFVGTPFENWSNNTAFEAGAVVFIPGSPTGLDTASAQVWTQDSTGSGGTEAGDRFGFALAAGTTAAGTPFVVVGSPGETVGAIKHAGAVQYLAPGFARGFDQDSVGVPGVAEAGDLYGYAVAASTQGFAVSTPAEAVGSFAYAGTMHAFHHPTSAMVPPVIGGIDQDTPGISGGAEVGDQFGASLAMTDYIPPGGTSADMATLIAVGSPGEDGGADDQGGVYEIDTDGALRERTAFNQGTSGVYGARESGDLFGSTLAVVNRAPGAAVSWDDLLIAVGSPGEDGIAIDDTDAINRGWVQTFSAIGEPGAHDTDADAALEAAGMVSQSGQRLGTSLLATATHLFVSDSWSNSPAVYGIPWDNLTDAATDPVLVYTPTDFGLTIADTASFGASLA